jgi:hypothetical protein
VACRKRDVEELGRPHTFLPVENDEVWYTALEARKGKPRHGSMLEPGPRHGPGGQAGGAELVTGMPTVCGWGVVSSIVLSGRESLPHGEGLDGSTSPGKDTHPGHVGPDSGEPTSLRALAIRGCLETGTFCTEASATEEPDTGKLYVRVCTRDVG